MYSRVAPPDHYSESSSSCTAECNTKSKCAEAVEEVKDDMSSDKKRSNVSRETWQKFQLLKERRRELCNPLPEKKKEKTSKIRDRKVDDTLQMQKKNKSSKILSVNEHAWKEICQNIDVNGHLSQDSLAKGKLKTKLEEKLDEAIKSGEFAKAESLSDEMAQQELGVKIVEAVEMRDYKKRKEVEVKFQKAKKKKKLSWGFEQKERWESKGNM